MNKKLVIYIFVFTILVSLCIIFYYVSNIKDNKIFENIDSAIKKIDNISLPEPLNGPNRNISADNLDSQIIIELTNQERLSNGEALLKESTILNIAAQNKIDDMFANQYFEHISPINGVDISNFVLEINYQYAYVGENLALGDFDNEEEMVKAWMNSPGHRENILNDKYKDIGVAVKRGKYKNRNTWIGVQVFARSAPNCIMPDQLLLQQIREKENNYKEIDKYNVQIDTLQKESTDLINQANDKITLGNKIYSDTGDTSQASVYWNEGENLYNEGVSKNNEANELINKINQLAEDHNNLKRIIDLYNQQIDSYNQCIKI